MSEMLLSAFEPAVRTWTRTWNPCSARLIGSSLLSDFHTPITRNPQTTWAEAEPVNLWRVSPSGQSLACGSGKAARCSSRCRWTRELLPRPPPPRHHFTDGPTEQRARLTHFIRSNPTGSTRGVLYLALLSRPELVLGSCLQAFSRPFSRIPNLALQMEPFPNQLDLFHTSKEPIKKKHLGRGGKTLKDTITFRLTKHFFFLLLVMLGSYGSRLPY